MEERVTTNNRTGTSQHVLLVHEPRNEKCLMKNVLLDLSNEMTETVHTCRADMAT